MMFLGDVDILAANDHTVFTLSMPWANSADDNMIIFFLFFLKNRL